MHEVQIQYDAKTIIAYGITMKKIKYLTKH
jgi:hypothetical protein